MMWNFLTIAFRTFTRQRHLGHTATSCRSDLLNERHLRPLDRLVSWPNQHGAPGCYAPPVISFVVVPPLPPRGRVRDYGPSE